MLYVNPLEAMTPRPGDALMSEAGREKVALEEFERFFVFTLLQEMRKSVPEDALLGGGRAEALYQNQLDDALAGEMARSGQLGIADLIADQLRLAEMQHQLRPGGA